MVDKIITELLYSNIFSVYCWFPLYQKLSEHAKITAIQRMWSLVKKPRQPARPCLGPPLPSWPWQAPPAPPRERRAPPPVHPHQTPRI